MKRESHAYFTTNEDLISKELPPIPKDRILTVKEVEEILRERQISIFEDDNCE